MALNLEQIKEILKTPKNKANILKAVNHEKRLNFHIETSMERLDASFACTQFLDYVKELLPRDKYGLFLALFRFPIYTNELLEQIFLSLKKVFQGRDLFADYQFNDETTKNDYLAYRDDELGGSKKWNEKANNAMKHAINSVIIVDLPEQTLETEVGLNEPYYYFKKVGSLLDYDTDENGNFNYCLFVKNERLYVYDNEAYQLFKLNDQGEIEIQISENFHGLGICPVSWFWEESLTNSNPNVKKSPVSNQLPKLDDLLFDTVSKRHLDLYAAYPIHWMYESDCDYKSPMGSEGSGEYASCEGGFIKNHLDQYMIDQTGSISRCPVCSDKRFAGAGSIIDVPYPDKDTPTVKEPAGVIAIERSSLDYNTAKIETAELKIYSNVVGTSSKTSEDQAFNVLQIAASYESKNTVLRGLKTNLEKSQEWTESTICKLRYGDAFKSLSFNYGTKFYLMNIEELLALYTSAKTTGASDAYLDTIMTQIIETQHSNNPIEKKRALISMELEPYRHMTKTEVFNLYKASPELIDLEELKVKLNFSDFIAKFERENIPLTDFGNKVSYREKINQIKTTLKNYAQVTG
jgi:hypothetical protein